jgi:hypothetical protein
LPVLAQNLTYTPLEPILRQYVALAAESYGINPNLAVCIVSHESQWVPDKIGPEKIGKSVGLWQIYLRAHPWVTKEMADDPIWATNWALMQIRNGHVGWWTTYHEYCDNLNVFL